MCPPTGSARWIGSTLAVARASAREGGGNIVQALSMQLCVMMGPLVVWRVAAASGDRG